MGFREPLDIEQYVQKLGGDGTRALGYRKALAPAQTVQERPRALPGAEEVGRPFMVGYGRVAAASSCTAVEITPTMVWDVNGYYRSLGFDLVFLLWNRRRITTAVLREAYHRTGGERSILATYALKQLRNPMTRFEYDRAPLDQPFYDDLVSEEIKLSAKREAGRRMAETGEEVEYPEVLDEWGLKLEEPAPAAPPVREPEPGPDTTWRWAYYVWRGASPYPSSRLEQWQAMLASEFSENGIHRRFAVGYTRRQPHSWVVAEADGTTVFFLNEEVDPTGEMAAKAVAYVSREDIDQKST